MKEGRHDYAALARSRAIAGDISFEDFCLAHKVRPAMGGDVEMSESSGSAVGIF